MRRETFTDRLLDLAGEFSTRDPAITENDKGFNNLAA